MVNYFIKTTVFVLVSLVGFVFSYTHTDAAKLYFGTMNTEVPTYRPIEIGVFVDTEGDIINAFEGEIVIPSNVLFREVRDGNTIASLWITEPTYHSSDSHISFSGITPGGFNGTQGYLFSIIAEVQASGTIEFSSVQEKMLLHDGLGTETTVTRAPLTLNARTTSSTDGTFVPPYDAELPESFVPTISQNPTIFDGRYFLVFATQDKGSGIWGYEVAEHRALLWNRNPSFDKLSWVHTESPYVLADQSRKSTIYVKAIDITGNERVVVIPPVESSWYENILFWCILLSLMLVGIVFVFVYGRKNKRISHSRT